MISDVQTIAVVVVVCVTTLITYMSDIIRAWKRGLLWLFVRLLRIG